MNVVLGWGDRDSWLQSMITMIMWSHYRGPMQNLLSLLGNNLIGQYDTSCSFEYESISIQFQQR